MFEIENQDDVIKYLKTLKSTLFTIYKDRNIYEIRSVNDNYDELVIDKHGLFLGRKESKINFYVFYKDSFESPKWLVDVLKDFYSDPNRFYLEDVHARTVLLHRSYPLAFIYYLQDYCNQRKIEIKIYDCYNLEVENTGTLRLF